MFISNTQLLTPNPRIDIIYRTPVECEYRGLVYDRQLHALVAYDRLTSKLFWIDVNTTAFLRSIYVDIVGEFIDATVYEDTYWCLIYKGDGRMVIAQGALTQAKLDSVMLLTEYDLPYFIPNPLTTPVFDLTHQATPFPFLRYHPKYCSLANIGPVVYVLAGLSNQVSSDVPTDIGQWILCVDYSGIINAWYKADDTLTVATRPSMVEEKMNGKLTAIAYHDGVFSGIALDTPMYEVGVLKSLYPNDQDSYDTMNQSYFNGNFMAGASLCTWGRKLYSASGNKIFMHDILMFRIYLDEDSLFGNFDWIDMGVLSPYGRRRRRVTMTNASAFYSYYNLIISVSDPNLTLSFAPDERYNWGDAIKYPGYFRPGETMEFFVQLQTPPAVKSQLPYNYLEHLTITAMADWKGSEFRDG